jgi:RNA polymerase sigma factor (sigma-70 family)
MQEVRDTELLRQYVRENSEEAFAALVTRHVNMVYSVALRKTGNSAAAEEITQAVFVILTKKADQLSRHAALSGWLYQVARLTAANFLRTEIRRARREQEAYMQSLSNQTESEIWLQIMPLLEDAMGRLGEKDRNALALRFFEGKSFQEIGDAFGASENAAKKRVAYALEKLRKYFSKRGVSSTTAIIVGTISANSVQAAPVTLAKSVTAVAIAKGAAASTSTLTLIKGALKIMAWTKAQTAIVVGVVVLLAAGTTTVVINKMRAGNQTADLQALTLKVNPDLLITNILAQANEVMNTPSNHWGDTLLDMLRIQGVYCGPPRGIALNTVTGEITARNTPDALEKFRRTVDELNQPGGRCQFFQRVPLQEEILFTAHFYKMNRSDFDGLGLGKPTSKATRNESAWWMLKPKQVTEIKQNLKSLGSKQFQERIDTGYGIAADLYSGESTNHIELEILPIAPVENPFGKKQMIDFKIQASTTGLFTNNSAGDWPNFADRTNCALFAEANVEDGGALAFHADNSANNDLMVLLEASIKTKK